MKKYNKNFFNKKNTAKFYWQFNDREMYVLLKNFDIQRDNKLRDITSYDLKSGKKLKQSH